MGVRLPRPSVSLKTQKGGREGSGADRRSGGKGRNNGQRSGGGAVRSLGGRVPVMLGKKVKNRTEANAIGPPPLENKSVSVAGRLAQNGYIASILRVSKKYYL